MRFIGGCTQIMPLRNVRAQCNLLYNLSITRSIDNFHGYLIRSRIYVHMYIRKFYVFGISLEKCFLRPFRTRSKFRYKISNRIFVSTLLLVLSNNFNSLFSTLVERKKSQLFSIPFSYCRSIFVNLT